jgi:uncharacterized membrane protein YciS (DUF1049 family)
MNTFWAKFWIWTRVLLLLLAVVYLMALLVFNAGDKTNVWLFPTKEREMSIVMLAAVCFGLGAMMSLIGYFTFRAVLRFRRRGEDRQSRKLKHEIAEINRRALQVKTMPAPRVATPTPPRRPDPTVPPAPDMPVDPT